MKKAPIKQRTAVIQVRVSSKRQADEELPLESQLARCEETATKLNAIVLKTFVERGKSGWSGPRPEFEEALAYCEQHRPHYFITWSTSRFARNQVVAVNARKRLAQAETELVYVSFDPGPDKQTRWMLIAVREIMDEYQSRQTSADTIRSMQQNAKDGFFNGGRVPFGYRAAPAPQDPKRKTLAIDPAEAPVVREMFRRRIDGEGSFAIAKALNEAGHKNRSAAWTKKSVTNVLRGGAAKGCQVYNRRPRPFRRIAPREEWLLVPAYESIVDDVTWGTVQCLMDAAEQPQESGSPLSMHLFTGLLVCGRCGAKLHTETANSRGRRYSYYRCSTAQERGDCPSPRLSSHELDDFLVDVICDQVLTHENLLAVLNDMSAACGAWSSEQKQRVSELGKEITTLERRCGRLIDQIEDPEGRIDDARLLVRRLQVHQERLDVARAELAEIERGGPPGLKVTATDLDELGSFLRETIRTTQNPKKTRAFFGALIERIRLEDDRATVFYRPEVLMADKKAFAAGVVWLPGTGSNRRPSD